MQVKFPLPITDVPARLAVRADGVLNSKDYVLKFRFPGVDSTRELAEEVKLHFSEGLGALFLYNSEQDVGQVGYTNYFHLPDGVESLTIEIVRWSKREELANIQGVDLQIRTPSPVFNKLTQIGFTANGI
ncbi:hypothetical protein [Corynebacterium sp. HMSC074A01]|uniref:hypothetical protein n=1 Tax=Corynebacterium sp. HMSC074A01 TaxID=1715030 RepID=UPI0008A3A60F|nr:hypothetical protein [Corynebacterium sp. HMSC074A01]OHF36705.1 hypothetical protein HMPREF2550_06570 [Corynebacterium sp. HMSC074A01]